MQVEFSRPPSAQSPFAWCRCYPTQGGVAHLLGEHYPSFIAPTGSCAGPRPSHLPRLSLRQWVFAGCSKSLLGNGPSRRYFRESFPRCLDLYPGGPSGAHARYFPEDIGLRHVGNGSALHVIRTATSVREILRGCSHSLMFRLPRLQRPPDCAHRSGAYPACSHLGRLRRAAGPLYSTQNSCGYPTRAVVSLRV